MSLHNLVLALALIGGPSALATADERLRVIDGHTIILVGERIRIANIDAPKFHSARCPAERRLALLARAGSRNCWNRADLC